MHRLSLPGPVDGGSSIFLAIQVAVSSNSTEEEETADRGLWSLILLLADLLAIAFTSQRFFHALLLTGLQIKRVTLNFLDNVFRLHFALKASQCVLKGFAFLNSNLCQENTPPNIPNRDTPQDTPLCRKII
jgi:hypothetical protein